MEPYFTDCFTKLNLQVPPLPLGSCRSTCAYAGWRNFPTHDRGTGEDAGNGGSGSATSSLLETISIGGNIPLTKDVVTLSYRSCPLSPRLEGPLPSTVYVPEKGIWECKIKAFSLNSKFLMKPERAGPSIICTKSSCSWSYSPRDGSKADQLGLSILQDILEST